MGGSGYVGSKVVESLRNVPGVEVYSLQRSQVSEDKKLPGVTYI